MHVRDTMIHVGGYHEHIRECSGSQHKSKTFVNLFPHMNHHVLMVSLRCTKHPQCSPDISPHES